MIPEQSVMGAGTVTAVVEASAVDRFSRGD